MSRRDKLECAVVVLGLLVYYLSGYLLIYEYNKAVHAFFGGH